MSTIEELKHENLRLQQEVARLERFNAEKKERQRSYDLRRSQNKITCDCGGQYRQRGQLAHNKLKQHQQWLANAKPKVKPSETRLAHLERQREIDHANGRYDQIACGCGGHYIRKHTNRHNESTKHQQFIKQQ
ncbi:hypothetical protein AaE_002351 [Aphanomyces astaci]|uniref:Uncharacterized protein n=1 Tax=Aphanomyces astaci TaxID=112090 RepID=A0A6A5AFQ9_APHAT|nr:hypothetical protein AaE_002351 [Aphanomyces astaci]